jgi:hypothetical protein
MAMIREVLYQHIRGVSERKISRTLNISRTTVSKYIKLSCSYNLSSSVSDSELNEIAIKIHTELYNAISSRPFAMNLLKKHKADIEVWLKHPNMTNTQIKRLLEELGTSVSVSSIDRFISTSFPKLPKHTVRLKTEAGKEGQVDFGYVGMMKNSGGSLRKTYAFVMILSHSRHRYVEFVNSQDQLTWAQLHINAFKFFNGVPSRIILDNLKAGVIKSDIYDPILNETYSELSRFYGFIIDPARAYKPEHKGKVERSIRIVKEQLIAGREYKDIGAANSQALKWCQDEISHRVCSSTGRKPIDVFAQEEKCSLMDLPSGIFDMPLWTICKVHKDHHFVVKGNFYSVPTKYIGEDISVRVGLKTVSAYVDHNIIKTHARSYASSTWVTDDKDYSESALHYLNNNADKCLGVAEGIGEATQQVISRLVTVGSRIGLRKAQAILRLKDKYDSERLELACVRAVAYDNYAYKAIAKILEENLEQESITPSCGARTVSDVADSAYIRKPEEYSSDMEVNYAS